MACKYTYKNKEYSKYELGKVLQAEESKKIADRLIPLLHASGIKQVSIENYESITGKKVDKDVTALADSARQLIAVNESKASENTLPEEISHLVIPNYEGTREYDRAMELVESTPEYKENEQVYMQKYKGDKRLVKLEVLGKLLSNHIVKAIKREGDNRLLTALGRMWKKFKNLFVGQTDLKNFLDTVSGDILQAEKINVRKDIPVMYQVDDKYEKMIQRMINSLKLRLKSFERKGKENVELSKTIAQLAEVKNLQGISIFLKHMASSSEKALSQVRDIKEGNKKVTANFLQELGDYIAYYEPYVHELRQAFLFDAKNLPYKKKDIKAFKKTVNQVTVAFEEIKDFRSVKREQELKGFLDKFVAKEFGLDINSDTFYEDAKAKIGYDYRTELSETHRNSNFLEFWFGSAKNASDEIIRMVHAIIKRVKKTVFDETLDFGKQIYSKAKELGLDHKDMSWAFEKFNGKYTGRFINETRDHEFNLARALAGKSFLEQVGASSYAEINKWRELEINEEELKTYGKLWKAWFKANAMDHPRAREIYDKMLYELDEGIIDLPTFIAWENANVGVSHTGQKYFKGALKVPNSKWANKEYKNLSPNQLTFLKYIKKHKEEIDQYLPNINENSLAPQISESLVDILHRKNSSIFNQIGQNIKDSFITKEDDKQYFGQQFVKRPDGSLQKYVPVYYTKLLGGSNISAEERLEETNKISTDLISTMVAYKQMQSNFTNMSKVAPEMDLLQEQVGVRRMLDKSGQEIPESNNYTFKVIEKFLEMNMYGKNKELLEANVLGRKVNLTKIIDKFAGYVRNNNLAWNFFTTFSNAVQGTIASKVEDLIGLHSNQKSKMFAQVEFLKHLPKVAQETADIIKKNKLSVLMEHFQMGDSLYSAFDNLDKSKLTKKAIDSGLYWSYEMTDFFIKGKLLIAILHNHRQLPDGSYVTKREYKGDNWDNLPNLWEQIEVKDGKIEFADKHQLRRIGFKVEEVANGLDGKLTPEDYAAAHQGAITQLVTVHRSWLFSGIQRRFKKEGFNWQTGIKEQGYYRSAWNYIISNFLNENKLDKFKQWSLRWEELNDVEKAAVRKVAWEHAFTLAVIIIAKMINDIADDDEDYDLAAYLSNRVILETGAFSIMPPLMISEMTNTLRDPLVPMRQVEMMFDWGDMIFGNKEIESGQWKGYTKREKAFLRLLPIVKPNIIWNDPGKVNQILKSRPLKMIN